jgi:hypothetical protein
MQITNNQVGPSGWSPTMADGAQFKKRALGNDEPEGLAPSQWADGISLACSKSTVTGNTVKDCTDGGSFLSFLPSLFFTISRLIATRD